MKQIIMNVLDDMSESQINLASETARETVSSLISAALKTNGFYKEYTEYELDEQKARASWVCSICGENTFEVDSDYIGTGTNHLGCEMKSWDEIKDHVNEKDDSDSYTGPDREKNWLQKKHENKVFGGDTGIDADFGYDDIPEGLKRAKELSQEALEEGLKAQLSEEIVDNKDEKYIYESPDGGKTVYKRKFGEDERELVTNWKEVNKNEG